VTTAALTASSGCGLRPVTPKTVEEFRTAHRCAPAVVGSDDDAIQSIAGHGMSLFPQQAIESGDQYVVPSSLAW